MDDIAVDVGNRDVREHHAHVGVQGVGRGRLLVCARLLAEGRQANAENSGDGGFAGDGHRETPEGMSASVVKTKA